MRLEPAREKRLLRRYYWPHRQRVAAWLKQQARQGTAHTSVGPFVYADPERHLAACDIGLLYDPQRHDEREFCRTWQAEIRRRRGDLKVRRNYPYLGKSDGLTTTM